MVHGLVTSEFPVLSGTGTASVIGVFSRAVYLEAEGHTVLLLTDSAYRGIPFGIGIADISSWIDCLRPKPGDPALLSEKELYFGCDTGLIRFSVLPAERRKPKALPDAAAAARWKESISGELLSRKKEWLYNRLCEPAPGDLFIRKALPAVRLLKESFCRVDRQKMHTAVAALSGLGEGLTPSMDDFLTGAASTLHYYSSCSSAIEAACSAFSEVLAAVVPQHTSGISAAYVLAAAEGKHFQMLDQVLDSIESAQPAPIQALLSVGNHSGGDMLTGILWALSMCAEIEAAGLA